MTPAGPGPAPLPASQDLRALKAADEPGLLALRGLTRDEYDNTVAALLGDTSAPARGWGVEVTGKSGFLEPRPVSAKEVQEYMEAAMAVADRAKGNLARLLGCDPAKTGEEACARAFVTSFGRRAFRRPLIAAEQSDYMNLWTTARNTHGLPFADAIGLVIEAMLQSPSFMYHWQLGPTPPRAEGQLVRLTAHEMAARLAYFLTAAPPDEALAAAADTGKILDPAELRAQAARLMGATAAKELLQDFVAQLPDVSELAISDDPLQRSFDGGRRAFVDKVLWSGKGTPSEMLLNPELHVDKALAKVYAVSGISGDALVPKVIDPAKRFGLLTHGDFLAKTGKGNDSLPPRRGKEVWSRLLCGELPADTPPVPPEIGRDPGDTMREHFEKKVEPIGCASACHRIVDNAGFAFESYGGPAWRDRDAANGKPIDASGTLKLPFGSTLSYSGTRDFAERLAQTEELRQCMVRQMFRMATRRGEAAGDATALKTVYDAFLGGGENLKTLAAAVVTTRAFSTRRLNPGEIAQ